MCLISPDPVPVTCAADATIGRFHTFRRTHDIQYTYYSHTLRFSFRHVEKNFAPPVSLSHQIPRLRISGGAVFDPGCSATRYSNNRVEHVLSRAPSLQTDLMLVDVIFCLSIYEQRYSLVSNARVFTLRKRPAENHILTWRTVFFFRGIPPFLIGGYTTEPLFLYHCSTAVNDPQHDDHRSCTISSCLLSRGKRVLTISCAKRIPSCFLPTTSIRWAFCVYICNLRSSSAHWQ